MTVIRTFRTSSPLWVVFVRQPTRNRLSILLLAFLISLFMHESVGRKAWIRGRTVAFLLCDTSGYFSSWTIIPPSTLPSTEASVPSPTCETSCNENRSVPLYLTDSPKRHRRLRGVMIGRMAMQNPWLLRHVDEFFYNSPGPNLSRRQVIERYVDYVERMEKKHCFLSLLACL